MQFNSILSGTQQQLVFIFKCEFSWTWQSYLSSVFQGFGLFPTKVATVEPGRSNAYLVDLTLVDSNTLHILTYKQIRTLISCTEKVFIYILQLRHVLIEVTGAEEKAGGTPIWKGRGCLLIRIEAPRLCILFRRTHDPKSFVTLTFIVLK